jgi:hypothetical protein
VTEEGEEGWWAVRSGLLAVLIGLKVGEVIEIAAVERFYLQLGRVPDQILFLASGPATADLDVGPLDQELGDRLRLLGFQPPDDDMPSWAYAIDVPADPVHMEFAAGIAVDALQQSGIDLPSELVWSGIGAGAATEKRAVLLGIRRSPPKTS